MKSLRQLINQSVHFKLKPVSVMIFTLFAQQAYAEALTLAQAEAQSKTLKQCIESVPNSRAKAMCKQNEQLHAQFALDEAFDKDIAASEKSAQTQSRLKLMLRNLMLLAKTRVMYSNKLCKKYCRRASTLTLFK